MAIYKYSAKNRSGGIIDGTIEAGTEEEAIEKLSQKGYFPLRIGQEREPSGLHTLPPAEEAAAYKIKSREITIFSRQMASLLKSGVPILSALNIISEQSEDTRLRNTVNAIRCAVKDGAAFSSTLRQYPKAFSSLYIAMVRTGENSGALPEALLRIADYRAREEEMLSRFRMALAYPVLMAIVGAATVIFMLTFVMPRLMGIFANMGEDLPLPTLILISISQGLRRWWFFILLGIAAIILIIKQQSKTQTGRLSLSLFKLHLPIFGNFILKAELSRFSRTMELLLRNGVPILKAIDTAIPVLENELLKNRLRQSYKDLEQGGSLGKSLKECGSIPIFMSNLLAIGEESGRLEDALAEIAGTYERDTDESMRVMSSLLEPLMILLMGIIVGFIVVAMLLPVFEINTMVR